LFDAQPLTGVPLVLRDIRDAVGDGVDTSHVMSRALQERGEVGEAERRRDRHAPRAWRDHARWPDERDVLEQSGASLYHEG
jgi:hypothetical protein